MSAYLIIEVTPSDMEKFGEYERQALPMAIKYGGEPLARDEKPLPIENDEQPALAVILKFPDKQAVRNYYESAEYAPLGEFRRSFCSGRALVIEA